MAEVVEVNDPDELEQFRLVWNCLLQETRAATFFQSLDWLQAMWRHYGHQQQMRILLARSGGLPVGILPLAVVQEPTGVGRIRSLRYPLDEWGSFFGPVGPHPTATLTAALRYLQSAPRDWDMIDLRYVNKQDIDRGRTPCAMTNTGFAALETRWKEVALIDIRGTWDDFFARRTSKFRNGVRRAERRAADVGEVHFERYRPRGAACGDGDPRWEMYDTCEEVARRSWQGSSQDGTTLSHASVRPFWRDAHAAAAKAGALDMALLHIGGRPAAFSYNYHFRGYVSGLRTGYDPEFAEAGVGKVLYARLFQDSFGRGDRIFDLGPDYVDVKRPWISRLVPSFRYTHYPLNVPRTQLLRVKHWLANRRAATA